jgi:hypothetical protein
MGEAGKDYLDYIDRVKEANGNLNVAMEVLEELNLLFDDTQRCLGLTGDRLGFLLCEAHDRVEEARRLTQEAFGYADLSN